MKQINTLIKPTHKCNMRCKYCFHEKYGYADNLLDINKLKKYIDLLCAKYNVINIVWHGREPLLAPLSYYEEIYNFCNSYDNKFIFSIQTNGTLINQEIIDFFKRRDTNFGLSFDGLNNEYTRGNTLKVLNNIGLLQENGFKPGAILVVNKTNISQLIDEYIKNFINFFKYWSKDKNGKINVSTCNELTNLILNENTGICTFNSCLGKWLCFDTNAYIYPCDRLCTSNFSLGNIDEISSINQIFENKTFLKLLKESIERRKKCINNCKYYTNCYSGCNANYILNKNDKYKNGVSCYIHKGILEELKGYVLETAKNPKDLNPQYIKVLEKSKNRR